MKRVFEKFLSLDFKFRIIFIFCAVMLISGTVMATYVILNNDNKTTEVAIEDVYEKQIEEITIENEEEIQEIVEEEPVKEVEEKVVKYKDKEVTVKKAEVAPKNSKEDAQKKKTGGEAISAENAVKQFENSGQSVGIDVSSHQGKINWTEVKNSGIEFAMIRAGFRGQTVGAIYEDTYFRSNITNAIKNGIKVGIYFYSCAINETEALEEAAWLVSVIKSYGITYPVAYDFEDFGRYRCTGVDGKVATANAKIYLDYIANAGYTPMLYANKNDITNRFSKSTLSNYKFWLAHYTSKTDYSGSYQMWQYTSKGSVPGISRKC